MAGENKVERLFMDVMNSGTVIASRSTADGALTLTPTDVDSVYAVSTLFDIGTLEAGYTLRVRANEDTPRNNLRTAGFPLSTCQVRE